MVTENVTKVLKIFEDFFGQDYVELIKNYYYEIVVFFPEVTVTNEYDDSIVIKELFVKVKLTESGKLIDSFTMNRSRYTEAEINSDYMHSHIPGIPFGDASVFKQPCLGRGPIIGTCNFLRQEFDEDRWQLFCYELSKYVTVESIEGYPYHRLKSVGINTGAVFKLEYLESGNWENPGIEDAILLDEFVIHYITKYDLKLNFINQQFCLTGTHKDVLLQFSKAYIDFINKEKPELISSFPLLDKAYINSEGELVYVGGQQASRSGRFKGQKVITFKGKDYCVKIDYEGRDNGFLVLCVCALKYIINKLNSIMNIEYEIYRQRFIALRPEDYQVAGEYKVII